MRIKMPAGHQELSLEGINYKPDEKGCFEVPDRFGPVLITTHGGLEVASLRVIAARITELENALPPLQIQLEGIHAELVRLQALHAELSGTPTLTVVATEKPPSATPRAAVNSRRSNSTS